MSHSEIMTCVKKVQYAFPLRLISKTYLHLREARWLSGRASDYGARGRVFETYLRRVVSLGKIHNSPKVLVIPRKRWLRPDMTEKLLTGTLNLRANKTVKFPFKRKACQVYEGGCLRQVSTVVSLVVW